jgi:C-terminal processing protease CtpA/Prc
MTVQTPRAVVVVFLVMLGCSSGVGTIGAVLGRDNKNGAIYVRDVPHGLAADKAGLVLDDQILMIDGVYAADLSPTELRQKLRGDVGSTVELTIVHDRVVRRVKVVRTALVDRPKAAPSAAPSAEPK